ncbi:MAG: sporulation transcriptional regulator SpoIIID [Clostridia bacterium]|nr:sporulation transcriptional regulator SpoIIID [Clostridia bacterium]
MEYQSRPEIFGYYMLSHRTTIRATAQYFNVSKSLVHYELSHKLSKQNPYLYCRVRELIEDNIKVRHLRGGEKTREKYMSIHASPR